jgi:hypothetical protein
MYPQNSAPVAQAHRRYPAPDCAQLTQSSRPRPPVLLIPQWFKDLPGISMKNRSQPNEQNPQAQVINKEDPESMSSKYKPNLHVRIIKG